MSNGANLSLGIMAYQVRSRTNFAVPDCKAALGGESWGTLGWRGSYEKEDGCQIS